MFLAVGLSSCGGGGGGGSSSSSDVSVRINIDENSFGSREARLAFGDINIGKLMLGYGRTGSTMTSSDVLSEINSTGYTTVSVSLNTDYTFEITAYDTSNTKICYGTTDVFLSQDGATVSLHCNSDYGDLVAEFITGVAAAGLPIVGTVYLKDANGTVVEAATDVDGSFSFSTAGLVPPFILKAEGFAGNTAATLLSYTRGVLPTANINPFTDLAVVVATGASDSASVYDNPSYTANMSPDAVSKAVTEVVEMFANFFAALGVTNFDPLKGSYSADGTGADGVLDHLGISISGGAVVVVNKNTGVAIISSSVSGISSQTITGSVVSEVTQYVSGGQTILTELQTFIEDFTLTQSRSQMTDYLAPDFNWNKGYQGESYLSQLGLNTSVNSAVEDLQVLQYISTTEMLVYFNLLHTDGSREPFYERVKEVGGEWYISGDGAMLDHRTRFLQLLDGTVASAGIRGNEPGDSQTTPTLDPDTRFYAAIDIILEDAAEIGAKLAILKGPGLPTSGLRLLKDGTEFKIHLDDRSSVEAAQTYFFSDAEITAVNAAIGANGYANYTYTVYADANQADYSPVGAPIAVLTSQLRSQLKTSAEMGLVYDAYFITSDTFVTHDIADLSSGQAFTVNLAKPANEILFGEVRWECMSLDATYNETSAELPISADTININMPTLTMVDQQRCDAMISYTDKSLMEYLTVWSFFSADALSNGVNTDAIVLKERAEYFDQGSTLGTNTAIELIYGDLALPTSLDGGVSIAWTSSDGAIISNSGVVYRPDTDPEPVTMTGYMTLNGLTQEVYLTYTVMPKMSARILLGLMDDATVAVYDMDNLSVPQEMLITSSSSMLSEVGYIYYDERDYDESKNYLLLIYNGYRRNMELDNFTVSNVALDGDMYTIVPGSVMVKGGFYANIFTDAAFRATSLYIITGQSVSAMTQKLNLAATKMISTDTDGLPGITYTDLLYTNTYTAPELADNIDNYKSYLEYIAELYTLDVARIMPLTETVPSTMGGAAGAFLGDYLIQAGATANGLKITNMANPASPADISTASLTDFVGIKQEGVYLYGNYVFVIDDGNGIMTVDLSDMGNPTMTSTAFTVAVTSQIKDIIFHPTQPLAYISNGQNISVVDITNPMAPSLLYHITNDYLDYVPGRMAIDPAGNYLYATSADTNMKLTVVDISSPYTEIDGTTDIGDFAVDTSTAELGEILIYGNTAYIKTDDDVYVVDITNRESPQTITTLEHYYLTDMAISGSYLYVLNQFGYIFKYSLAFPENPVLLQTISDFFISATADYMTLNGNDIYISEAEGKLFRHDLTASLTLAPTIKANNAPAVDLTAIGTNIYTVGGTSSVNKYSVATPGTITPAGSGALVGSAQLFGITSNDSYVFAGSIDGIHPFTTALSHLSANDLNIVGGDIYDLIADTTALYLANSNVLQKYSLTGASIGASPDYIAEKDGTIYDLQLYEDKVFTAEGSGVQAYYASDLTMITEVDTSDKFGVDITEDGSMIVASSSEGIMVVYEMTSYLGSFTSTAASYNTGNMHNEKVLSDGDFIYTVTEDGVSIAYMPPMMMQSTGVITKLPVMASNIIKVGDYIYFAGNGDGLVAMPKAVQSIPFDLNSTMP